MHDTPPAMQLAPEWLAHRYDPGRDAIHFVKADRGLRRTVPFLIDANLPGAAEPFVVGRREAMAVAPGAAALHFIFHSAYCCSTLLANLLDQDGLASSVKEPTILNDLVGWRHRGAKAVALRPVLDDALTLLARPFRTDEAVIVKPSNLVNALAVQMMESRPTARAVLLYAPLPVYLASIAAKGMWGRLWVRDLMAKQLRDGLIDLGFDAEDYLRHTDLQTAAVGWLAQHRLFVAMARRWPARVRLLDSEVLMARPTEALAAIGALYERPMSPDAIALIVAGDAFHRNSKDGRPYDGQQRRDARSSAAGLHADELEKVSIWAEAVATNAGVDLAAPDLQLLAPG